MSALVKLIKEQSVFNADEPFYVSNSRMLYQLITTLSLPMLYDPILNLGKASIFEDATVSNGKRLAEVQRLKIAYALRKVKGRELPEECKSLVEGITNTKVNARELIIYPFAMQYKGQIVPQQADKTLETSQTSAEASPPTGTVINEHRIFLLHIDIGRDAYLSTPRFIKYLTDLSSELMACDNKVATLRDELTKLNSKLPSNVYIPFVNGTLHVIMTCSM